MSALKRSLQVLALVGTILVGVLAVALIVSQTPWFKDWLRRYVVRESAQYLNGDLSIGSIGGNLFFGVELRNVALTVEGERVIAAKDVEVDYSLFRLISSGVVLDQITITEPAIALERDAQGWNLGRLVKEQAQEADREGPGRPIALSSIELIDGRVTIRDQVAGTSAYRLPGQINDLDVKASYEYEPVHYSIGIDNVSFTASSPDLTLRQLSGKIAVRDDNLYVDGLRVNTAESQLRLNGVVENYLQTPVVQVTTSGTLSMPELARLVPAVAPYGLHPTFDIKASGPAERLGLDLTVNTEAGNVAGQITADVDGPSLGAEGHVSVEHLNLAPLLQNETQRSDITGQATVDLDVAGSPEEAPLTERMSGTFAFSGPQVSAAGYRAQNVRVNGRIDGPRITLDARLAAYGGSATAKGFLVTPSDARALSFELRGSADGLDLKGLPASIGAPDVSTDLSVASYAVNGRGRNIDGTVRLNRSVVEGATLADGTTASFSVTPRHISYSAGGSVQDLDLERLGRAFAVAALASPEYASTVNGDFTVEGAMPRGGAARKERESAIADMTLQASGTVRDTAIMGGRLPELTFDTTIADGGLKGTVKGRFENFDPATIASRPDLKGNVSGTVDASVFVRDLSGPITPEAITGSGQVMLEDSTVAGLEIEGATVDATYENQVANVRQFTLAGPDLTAEASGQIALDRTSSSGLKYHIEAIDMPALAKLAGQQGIGGTAIIDGTVTGNRASLTTTGTLDGSNLSYKDNSALDLNSVFTVTVPELEFARAHVEATTQGTFVKAGGLEINELTATTTYDQQKLAFVTNIKEQTRELAARGDVILHPDHQELHLPEFAVRTQGVEWRLREGTEATIEYGQNRVELKSVQLVSGNQALSVDGTIALGGDAPSAKLDVTAKSVDLQQLETLLLTDRGLSGTLDANATITGTTDSPTVDGRVEIRNGGFETYRYESLVADVEYAGRRATVDATLTQTPSERITITGSVPMSLFQASERGGHVPPASGDEVDLRIRSTALGLGMVQGFTDQLANVTGTLEADIRVTGSGQDPHLEGYVDIKNGAFGVPFGGVSYTGLNTRIDLTPDTAKIQSFTILDEHGEPLSVSGELAVHEKSVGAVNLQLESDNFEIIDNELGDVGLDSTLRVTGELRRPKIEGRIRVEAGRIEVDRLLTFFYDPYATESIEVVSAESIVEASGSAEEATRRALQRVQQSAAEAKEAAEEKAAAEKAAAGEADVPVPAGIFEALQLDVNLVIPDNLVLRGSDIRPGGPTGAALGDMNITVGGDLQIRKSPGDQVRLVGEVQTIRGMYEFQGRRFELARGGRLRFFGETEINPILDLSASRLIPNTGVEATIRITGTVQAPELELTSNPPLEESDILALIVFNRPVNELGTGERSSLAATAGGIATGFIAAPLGESIGRALDLDLFEITTTTEEGELGAGITLGQQIGDRAFLKLRQQFGERNITEFLVEYQLARFLRLQASAAPETSGSANRINQRRIERFGIDVIFFFSY